MKKGLVTKIIGGIIACAGVTMAIIGIPQWGWVVGGGVLIVLIGAEQDDVKI